MHREDLHIKHLLKVKIEYTLLFILGFRKENGLLTPRHGTQCPCGGRRGERRGAREEESGDGNGELHDSICCC